LLQPLIILFFVHWLWHRLDLSLDAVVKYFASGFFICTSICILFEMLASALASILVFVASLLGALGMVLLGAIKIDEILTEGGDDDTSAAESNLHSPKGYLIAIALLAAFLNAFLVAALVEEIGKYLCFWMVEHPDLDHETTSILLAPLESPGATNPEGASEGEDEEKSKLRLRDLNSRPTPIEPIKAPAPSLVSRGTAITIAMVTTALGFACAENLLCELPIGSEALCLMDPWLSFFPDLIPHFLPQNSFFEDVFVYSPPGLDQEISTLIVRCLFPIHPLAAALQSTGVARRDIERDRSWQVGRIIWPGFILHGSFDFALMAYSQIVEILSPEEEKTEPPQSGAGTEEALQASAFMVSMVMLIPLIGMLYYFRTAWAQRERLEALDREGVLAALSTKTEL
jgi:hypothetical protein